MANCKIVRVREFTEYDVRPSFKSLPVSERLKSIKVEGKSRYAGGFNKNGMRYPVEVKWNIGTRMRRMMNMREMKMNENKQRY
jgi:hypothetical protein